MAKLIHELWDEDGLNTFCLTGPMGDGARSLLGPSAKLIWTLEAESYFDAMTKYYEFVGWGEYATDQEWDMQPYSDEWFEVQLSAAPPLC